jgi:hypothetical protein
VTTKTLTATVLPILLLSVGVLDMVFAPSTYADSKIDYWESLVCQPGTYRDQLGSASDVPHATANGGCVARTNGAAVFSAAFPSDAVALNDINHLYQTRRAGGTFTSSRMPNGVVIVFYAPGDYGGAALSPLLNDRLVPTLYGPPGPPGIVDVPNGN